MPKDKTFISIRISMEELEKINYLRELTDATTKAAVLRKGLYLLYYHEKQKYSGIPHPQPTEG